MPTGDRPGIGFGWGAYRTKFGAIRMNSTTNKTFSLSHDNARYIDSVPLGHKSAAVNSALTWYRGQGVEVHELLANIEGLQNVIAELYQSDLEQAPQVSAPGPVAPKSTSRMGGLRAILARMWPF